MSPTYRFRATCTLGAASAACLLTLFATGCGDRAKESEGTPDQATAATTLFMKEVRPIFQRKCVPCHNSETISGKLNLESRKTAFGGSDNGAFLVPGDPKASLIYLVTKGPHGDGEIVEKMPNLKGVSLSDAERESLRKWIEAGATWPGGDKGWIKPPKSGAGEV